MPTAITTPESDYTNAVILYHWRKCGYCTDFMPEWRSATNKLPSTTRVFELEVDDNRTELRDLGVDLGGGVPRIVAYNASGDEMVYEGQRTADEVGVALNAHLITSSPDVVARSHPATVLYFRHNCGYCVRFLPEFTRFAAQKDTGTVLAVDTAKYPDSMRELATPATGVPHVVHYDAEGNERVFQGERTVSGLKAFVNSVDARGVSFEGGSLMHVKGSAEARLESGLDRIQDRASQVLGPKHRRAFEPDSASVCFIGMHEGGAAMSDRVYILICPDKTPRGKPRVMAAMYGARNGDLTVKIYVGKDKHTLLSNKRRAGFEPVPHTNPYVQALDTFGYHVEMS